MNGYDLALAPGDRVPVAILAAFTVCYLAFHYAGSSRAWARRFAARGSPDAIQARAMFAQRCTGAVLLGVVPVAVAMALGYTPTQLGLGAGRPLAALAAAVGVGALVLPVVARAASRPEHRALYPEVRTTTWSPALVRWNAITWAVYLLGYEAAFRGVLLVPLVEHLGTWPAIAVNTALYVAVHLTKDASEATGTVVMGVVFALMALGTGSIWAPFALHVAVALTSDTLARRGAEAQRASDAAAAPPGAASVATASGQSS